MKKNLKTVFMSMLAGLALCACSSDKLSNEPDPVFPDDNGDGFYMGVDIQMPNGLTGSRSETNDEGGSTGGTEVGQEYENTVSSALIVLASAEDVNANLPKFGFIAASEVQNNRIADLQSSNSKQYRATARMQKTNIHWLYQQMGDNGGAPMVYVFVFCNPNKDLVALFTTGLNGRKVETGNTWWLNERCAVIQGSQTAPDYNVGIWGSNSFLMNNERLAIRELPANEIAWENHNTADKAFHLSDDNPDDAIDNSTNQYRDRGSVRVERSVARFDFRDGSPLGSNTYPALYALKNDGTPNNATNPDGTPAADSSPLINVKLQKMCLVNMADSFYYIPRVSANGLMVNPTYCGAEKPWNRNDVTGEYTAGNYVVGPFAKMFNDITLEKNFSKYFNYPFFEDNGQFNNEAVTSVTRWDVVSIDDVLNGQGDNYNGENYQTKPGETAPTFAPGGYKIWRYVTENVIPGAYANQVNGISTGVIFRGRILGSDKFDKNETGPDGKYPEEDWAKGNYENLLNCINGKPFTFNGKTMTITGNSHTDPILYYYQGSLYMGWRTFRQAAIQAAITYNTVTKEFEINRSNSLYQAVFGDGPIPSGNVYVMNDGTREPINDPRLDDEGEQAKYEASADYAWNQWNGEDKPVETPDGTVPATLKAFREKAVGNGVAIYQSAIEDNGTPGYYCYYYYWNRHNDNGIPGVMGPMEFDVVRNNVYKLSVDKISRLGHPRLPDNDPEKPTPGTPDESDQIYLDVRVTIVPWAVRLNSIQF